MKILYYLKYFYFVTIKWNLKLAFFTIGHEIKGEKKYRINTARLDWLHNAAIKSKNLSHSSIYQGVNYFIAEKAFNYLKNENACSNIVDFGSGKGRAMVIAAHYGFHNITGIEFSPVFCNEAEKNIAGIKPLFPSTNFKIICEDAVNYEIDSNTNVFFFFNPFDEVIMLQVAKNILLSLKQYPRKVYIVYINPVHEEIFLSAGFQEEYYFVKLEYLEMSILSKDPWVD